MADLKETALALLSSTASCNLNAAADTEKALYVVPTAKKMIPVIVVMHTFSADTLAAVVTFGKTGGTCDGFLGDQTLTGITAGYADEALVLMAVPAATTVVGLLLDAAETFGMEITTAAGSACTCTIDVFGIIYDA